MTSSENKSRRTVLGGLVASLTTGAVTPLLAQQQSTPQLPMPGIYVREIPPGHAIAAPETSVALFVDRFGAKGVKTIVSAKDLPSAAADPAAIEAVKLFFENGGRKAILASTKHTTARGLINDRRGGLKVLLNMPPLGIDFICVPPAALLSVSEAASVYQAALNVAEKNKAMLLVDAPSVTGVTNPVTALTQWASDINLDSPNAAFYAPRVMRAGASSPSLPASAVAAGVAARIDIARGVWKAPAGTEASVRGAEPEVTISNSDSEILNPAGVNPIRNFAGAGTVIWGSRTLSSDPEWKYVPVRRTALFIEKALDDGLGWAVFEPNDEPLWADIRQSVGAFLENLWRQGALQGAKAEDAFFVRCDRSTTTQADIDNGICNVVLGFAPLKPAEFVIFRIGQKTADA